MMRKKVIAEMLIIFILGVIFESIFFRQLVSSNFDLQLGDLGDERFNGVILEHWWQVFQGHSTWLSPIFFYPAQGVLGYSDVGFLFALPYSAFRYLGLDIFTSHQIVLLSVVFMGWIGVYVFLRYYLRLKFYSSVMGTILFSFPNSFALLGQTQFYSIYFLPYFAIAIFIFIKNFDERTIQGLLAGVFISIFIPCLFYTSFYVGWFTMFFILSLFFVFFIWFLLLKKEDQLWRNIFLNKRMWNKLHPYFSLSAICFIPFLITYIPVYMTSGGRPYWEILGMLPLLVDYINVGSNNWFWNNFINSFFLELETRHMSHELFKGLSFGLFSIFSVISIFFIGKMRNFFLQINHNGSISIVSKKDSTNEVHWRKILVIGLSLTVFLVWLLMLKIDNSSIWWFITKIIPGAGSIRAVFRFQQFLIFPISIVVAVGINQAFIHISQIKSKLKQRTITIYLVLFCLFLIIEQYNTKQLAGYSKQEQLDMLASIKLPPYDAEVFTLLPDSGLRKNPFETQIDAMVIAQKFNLPTINGYSASSPPDWNITHDINDPFYSIYLNRWINYHNLNNAQLYFLNLKTGAWLSAKELNVLNADFYPLMTEAITNNSDFALKLSLLEVPDNWKKNEVKDCKLKAINNGNVTFTSFGADYINPHKYAIKLSYRWVKLNETNPLGFDNRFIFPLPVKTEITFSSPIIGPPESGSYYLEIEAVQENVAWFKDKGYSGIKVKVDIL